MWSYLNPLKNPKLVLVEGLRTATSGGLFLESVGRCLLFEGKRVKDEMCSFFLFARVSRTPDIYLVIQARQNTIGPNLCIYFQSISIFCQL